MVYANIWYILAFFGGIAIGDQQCNRCQVNLTQPLTESDPPCQRPDIHNCTKENEKICGSILQIKHEKVEYRELCLPSTICANTSAVDKCPKSSCYIYCCHGDLCNQYDKTRMLANSPDDVQNFIYSTTVAILKSTNRTTPNAGTTPNATASQTDKPGSGGVPSFMVVSQISLVLMFTNMLYMQY